jgi:hypothetical protein
LAGGQQRGGGQQERSPGLHVALLFWLVVVLVVAGLVCFSMIGLAHQ